jgi:hypothetical protein
VRSSATSMPVGRAVAVMRSCATSRPDYEKSAPRRDQLLLPGHERNRTEAGASKRVPVIRHARGGQPCRRPSRGIRPIPPGRSRSPMSIPTGQRPNPAPNRTANPLRPRAGCAGAHRGVLRAPYLSLCSVGRSVQLSTPARRVLRRAGHVDTCEEGRPRDLAGSRPADPPAHKWRARSPGTGWARMRRKR